MAFGINRSELNEWKRDVMAGKISFLTHYWQDERFPKAHTVTKVGCIDINILAKWGKRYGLKREWIHMHRYPHFDLFEDIQKRVLKAEKLYDHIERFQL
ncbi:MAG TPA: hypothetical protein VK029_05075 [Pseudogracilibacillus sp.]|nr:hypothetical protein [Pseudogracilibacillus sp.]